MMRKFGTAKGIWGFGLSRDNYGWNFQLGRWIITTGRSDDDDESSDSVLFPMSDWTIDLPIDDAAPDKEDETPTYREEWGTRPALFKADGTELCFTRAQASRLAKTMPDGKVVHRWVDVLPSGATVTSAWIVSIDD